MKEFVAHDHKVNMGLEKADATEDEVHFSFCFRPLQI